MKMLAQFVTIDYVVLLSYLAAMVAMGAWFSRREKTTDDFFRGGRRVPWWAAGVSIFGTALSAITYMSMPVESYTGNWTSLIISISPIVLVGIVSAVYIPFFRRLNVTTPYEYLESRFNAAARLLASGQWVVFQIMRISIILYLPSLALSAATGMSVVACIFVMGVVATMYTVLGGIEAVIWTDVIQVVVLTGGAVASLVVIFASIEGGVGAVMSSGLAEGKFQAFNWSWQMSASAMWVLAIGAAVNNFAVYTTDQQLVQRYMCTPTVRQSKAAIWTSALGGIPTAVLFFMLGTSLWAFYAQHPELAPADSNKVFAVFIVEQLPAGLSGLLIAGIFAAAMSSVDSGVNSISAAVTTDFVKRFNLVDEKYMLIFARVIVIVTGMIGTVMAVIMANANIQSIYMFFMGMLGMFVGPLAGMFVLGMFTKRCRRWGAVVGFVTSAAVIVICVALGELFPVPKILWGAMGLLVCVGAGYLASMFGGDGGESYRGLTVYSIDQRLRADLVEPPACESMPGPRE